jgi:hypothetical protein
MTNPDQRFISEEEFVDRWGARAKESGDLYFYDEVISLPVEHVWTISEGEELDEEGFNVDGNWYATPGVSVVNALGYVTTEMPWIEATTVAVWYLDDDQDAIAERRAAFNQR